MAKQKSPPAPETDRILVLLWTLGAAAFWLVPDQKLLREKLLAVQVVVLLAGTRLAWRGAREAQPGRRSPLDVPAAALAAVGLLFWAFSSDLALSQSEATRLVFCGLAFWTASRTFAITGIEPFLSAWTAGACAAGLWAVAESLAGQSRPFASFGNPIFLGTALASSLPFALAQAFEPAYGKRSLWTAAAALQGTALFLTCSRAAVFGLLASLVLWAAGRLKGLRLAQALGAAAAFTAVGLWAFHGREWTHGLIWRDTLALWRSRPWFGCGLGRFHLEFPAFASEALRARWPQGRVVINFAHNEYLQTLAETGPLGLAALAAIPLTAWILLKIDAVPAGRLARGAATSGALALFSSAFVSPDLRFGASAFAAFTLLGAARPAQDHGSDAPWFLLAPVLLIFGGLALQPALAVRRNAAETPFQSQPANERLRALEERLSVSPNDVDAVEEIAYLKAKASDFNGARAAFLHATQLAPSRPGPLNNLGNLSYLSGDFDGAIGWWEKSIAVSPKQIDARLNLAKLLCERGRLKECSGHLEEVLRQDPSNAKARVLYKKMIE